MERHVKEVPELSVAHDRHDGRDDGTPGDGRGEYIRYLRLTGRDDPFLDIQERTAGKSRVRWLQRIENLLSIGIVEDERRIRLRCERFSDLLPELRQSVVHER